MKRHGLFALISLVLLISTVTPVVAQGRASSNGRADTSASKTVQDAVDVMVKQGLIKRFDLKTGKFYVSGPLWNGFELDAKQRIVKLISKHRDFSVGLPQVTLFESKSGKELANYGPFLGVTIR